MNRKLFVIFLLTLHLCACSNLASVRTFASATSTVTTSTSLLINDDQATCERRVDVELEFYQTAKMDTAAASSQAEKINCSISAAQVKRILAYNNVLENYASALTALAQDSYVTVTGDTADVSSVLSNLQSTKLTTLTAGQTSAVQQVSGFVISAALDTYRHAKIADALSSENISAVKEISSAIRIAVQAYDAQLAQEDKTYDLALMVMPNVSTNESLANQEYALRINGLRGAIAQKRSAIITFNSALTSMDTALDAAASDVKNPNTSEISSSVISYAKQAYAVQVSLRNAFTN